DASRADEIEANRKGWPEKVLRFEEFIRAEDNTWYENAKSRSHTWMNSNKRFQKVLTRKMERFEKQGKWTYTPKAREVKTDDLDQPVTTPPVPAENTVTGPTGTGDQRGRYSEDRTFSFVDEEKPHDATSVIDSSDPEPISSEPQENSLQEENLEQKNS